MTAQSTATSSRRVDQLLEKINASVAAWKGGDERSRNDVVHAAFKLAEELEAPSEFFTRTTWEQPAQLAAIRTGLDLDLFRHINAEGPPKTTAQLAEAVNADPALMSRIMRVLASTGIVHETEADHFTSTPMTLALVDPVHVSATKFGLDWHIPSNYASPAYLRENKYQNASDMVNTPTQQAHGGKGEMNLFQLLHKSNQAAGFEAMMKAWAVNLKHWSDDNAGFYPFNERLVQGAKKSDDEVFLVDVGGGQGIDCTKLLNLHPAETIPGPLVLQDLPQLIDTIPAGSLSDKVRPMVHDYYTPQPIKGARAYFFHAVIHDHTDERAKAILKLTAQAMTPGYSKILIWDYTVPDESVPSFIASLDWQMLVCVAGTERTERDWRRLLEDPELGLKVTGIWNHSAYNQSLIEAELA